MNHLNIDDSLKISLYFVYIGLALWFFSYLYLAFFGMVSEYTGTIFRIKYLTSVLRQDISWFEDNDPQSLASKINKESLAIQVATGEKAAGIIFSFTMLFAGVGIAFALGWKFTMALIAILPFFIGIILFLVIVLQMGFKVRFEFSLIQ